MRRLKVKKVPSNLVVLSVTRISYTHFSHVRNILPKCFTKVGYADLKEFSTPLRNFIFYV